MPETRLPAVAGTFYPGDPKDLQKMIDEYLASAKDVPIEGRLRGLVIPHAGYIYSGPVAAYGYRLLAHYRGKIRRIILLGPSHYAAFFGACESGFDSWQTPLGIVRAVSLRGEMPKEFREMVNIYPEAHAPEHCLEVQLPFLQTVLGNDLEVWPLLCGEINPATLASAILPFVDDRSLVLASSDLSHYLPYAEAVKIDGVANRTVPALDISGFTLSGDACGKIGILTLMNIAKKKGWKGKLLDYRNSGDTAGPKDGVVGYGCYAFSAP